MQTAFSASTEQVLVHLLLQIAVILAVSRVTGEVFRRLGQSHSIGEILSGVMLGPSLLGWMAPETFTWIFRPEGPVLLPYLSHLGLVLALFLIGMEFDFRTVRPHLGKVSSTAIATLLAPMAAAAALAPWLWSIAPGQGSYEAYTLFVGLVMAITAIPIMGRLLMEQGLTRTRMGVLAITSGAAKDVVTWLLLAVVSGIARPPLDPWHVGAMVLGTVLLALNSLTLVRWLIGWGQERFGWEGDRPSGALITFLLVILVLQAAASAEIGIFAILGAFLTGVSVSSDRRLSEAVADRLHDLTFYLFLPIFFTYTGLRCDLTELAGALWLAMIVVTVVGSLAVGGVAVLIARQSGMQARESLGFGALVNTPGLMILILLNIGLDLGVIPTALFSVMVGSAMLRNLVTTPILRWAARSELPPG